MTSLTEHDLKIKLQQRTSIRGNVTKAIKKVNPLFADATPDVEQAEVLLAQLHAYQEKLNQVDEIVAPYIEDEQLADEIERTEQYQDSLLSAITTIKFRLRNISLAAQAEAPPASPGIPRDVNPRLPKLEIAKYSGDPLMWDEFWDDFKSSVHDRQDLPIIDKFKYLKSFLIGDALRLADGYRLTVANYDAVLDALKERFGDPQIATHSHFEALIALPKASHDLSELRTILDKCESHIRSLVALGLPETTFGVVFTPLILSKLPKFVKMELHRKNGSSPWTLANLRTLLKEEIHAREKSERSFANIHEEGPESSKKPTAAKNLSAVSSFTKRSMSTTSALASPTSDGKSKPPGCVFCSGKHFSGECMKYRDLKSRRERAKGHCFSCLRQNHRVSECRSKRPCFHCRKECHHQSLCPEKFGKTAKESDEAMIASASSTLSSSPNDSSSRKHSPEVSLSLQTPSSKSILQTALVQIGSDQRSTSARFFFDTGGSRSFVRTAVAKQIGAKHMGNESVSVGRFRDSKRTTVTYKIFEFDVYLPDGQRKTVRMSGESTISCPIQLVPLDPVNYPILSCVKLAEPLVKEPTVVPIDVLVGTDYYYEFMGQEQVRCSNGLVLLSSLFGYVVGGCLTGTTNFTKLESSLFLNTVSESQGMASIERFWNLESIGIKDDYTQHDDDLAVQSFNESVKFEDGRYFVKWPWKGKFPDLPDNYGLALGRLKGLVKRLTPQKELLSTYQQTIQTQLDNGIIEIAPEIPDGMIHYIPHHCVVTPSKVTTKLRVVYDASAKLNNDALSLNDCLHRGPVMLPDSVGILLRFRLSKVAVVSDIEKAFLQIGLQSSERDVTRFLWMKDSGQPLTTSNLQIYRFCRVPFGVVSSPFLLAATITHHLRATGNAVASSIEPNVYVDNVFGGLDTDETAWQYYLEAKKVFASASMNLREWFSNSSTLMTNISPSDRGKGSSTSVLGLNWNLSHDTLQVSVGCLPDTPCVFTKRQVLQSIASVFDPCGFFAPVLITGKIVMQQLWKAKLGWDEKLPEEIGKVWQLLLCHLREIPNHKILRQLNASVFDNDARVELHCFCDASTKAYAAVVYLCIVRGSLRFSDLIFAKAKVAPIKPISVPRLELITVLIGSRATKFVEAQLGLPLSSKFIWTDSSCVLHWITGKPVTATFVQNRLREIKSHTDITFRFVPTASNPADLPSRGVSMDILKSSSLWWCATSFVRHTTTLPGLAAPMKARH